MACMSSAQRVAGWHRNRIQAVKLVKANIATDLESRNEAKASEQSLSEDISEVRWDSDIGIRRRPSDLEDLVSPAPNVPPLHATPYSLVTSRSSVNLLSSTEGPHDILRWT